MNRPKTQFLKEPAIIERSKMRKTIHGEVMAPKDSPTIKRDYAIAIGLVLIAEIRSRGFEIRASFAGSIRREVEDIHDIDILVSPQSDNVRDYISKLGKTLWNGTEKISIMLKIEDGRDVMGVRHGSPTERSVTAGKTVSPENRNPSSIQIDIRFIEPKSWGPALQYFTGSREHNISLRSIAKRHGLTLNEHGLFDSSGTRVDDNTEGSIYKSLGLRWLPPRYRNSYINARKKKVD